MRHIHSGALSLALLLSACGGRAALPVASTSSLDDRKTCAHLDGEIDVLNARLAELQVEGKTHTRENIALLLITPLSFTAPLSLDLRNTREVESRAILARKDRVLELRGDKGCAA